MENHSSPAASHPCRYRKQKLPVKLAHAFTIPTDSLPISPILGGGFAPNHCWSLTNRVWLRPIIEQPVERNFEASCQSFKGLKRWDDKIVFDTGNIRTPDAGTLPDCSLSKTPLLTYGANTRSNHHRQNHIP